MVDETGTRYRYVGLVRRDIDGRYDVNTLDRRKWIVRPGLIYASEQPTPLSPTPYRIVQFVRSLGLF